MLTRAGVFFVLSKLLDVVVDPLWWGLVPLAVTLFALRRGRTRLAVGTAVGALTVLAGLSLPAISNRLWGGLEAGAVNTVRPGVTYDAVVLLGGAVSAQGSLRDEPSWNENADRLLAVQHVLASGQAKVAIVSGGTLGGDLQTEAEYLAAELVKLGIAPERVLVESKASNTLENAQLSKAMLETLDAHQVLIVTSAFHMPRAMGCFRDVGLTVDALPVDYRMRHPEQDSHWFPRAEYLGQSARALREWLGRAVYAVRGSGR